MEFEPFKKVSRLRGKPIGVVAAVNPRGHILILESAMKRINEEFVFTSDNYVVEIGTEPSNHNYLIMKIVPIEEKSDNCYKVSRRKGKDVKKGVYIYCSAFLKHLQIYIRIQDVPIEVLKDESGNYILLDLNQGITSNGEKYGS